MKTAAAIDAGTRLLVFAGAIIFYQHLLAVYVEHDASKSWANQLWKRASEWYAKQRRERIPEPSAFKAIRMKRTVELPQEPSRPE